MKKPAPSEWRFSTFALSTMLGTFIGIFAVQRELNPEFVIGYLTVLALIVVWNAIYVFSKKKKNKNKRTENDNQQHG